MICGTLAVSLATFEKKIYSGDIITKSFYLIKDTACLFKVVKGQMKMKALHSSGTKKGPSSIIANKSPIFSGIVERSTRYKLSK